jgi:hypothetical protein
VLLTVQGGRVGDVDVVIMKPAATAPITATPLAASTTGRRTRGALAGGETGTMT